MEKSTETLERIGQALFGANWLNQMAAEVQVNDRTMRHWMSKRDPIPASIWRDIERVMRNRAAILLSLADALGGAGDGFQTQVGEMRPPTPRDRG